jgi:hypothetical protein
MTAVVVAEALANKPGKGGAAWVPLSWVRGFQRLGLDVWFVEELAGSGCGQRGRDDTGDADSSGLAYFRDVFDQFGLADRAVLLAQGEVIAGPPLADLFSVASSAVLVNIGGHLTDSRLVPSFRTRVMVDLDPGFTQFWHASGDPGDQVPGHDLYFTVGENIGKPGCPIPTSGIRWHPVRQPVVMTDWPVLSVGDPGRFTTVANWRGPFGTLEFSGRSYGLKVHEFRKFIDLPLRSPYRFEVALDIHPDDTHDLEMLRTKGWRIINPGTVATPDAFRSYVRGSGAELSAAQGMYVDTGSGWFSDRSVRYLASGRPVLLQDTGFSRNLPVGHGLMSFGTVGEAVEGASRIVADYESHAEAARSLAEKLFDSDRVLARFCEQVGI